MVRYFPVAGLKKLKLTDGISFVLDRERYNHLLEDLLPTDATSPYSSIDSDLGSVGLESVSAENLGQGDGIEVAGSGTVIVTVIGSPTLTPSGLAVRLNRKSPPLP